jgi:phosphatidylglycerol:prolipoprotein diacylglycerol transferase
MIPYIELPTLALPWGLRLEAFSVVSTIGIVVGGLLAARAARRYGPGDDRPLRQVAPAAIIGGLLGAHLMHVFAYHPELLRQGPGVLLRFWEGQSSMGGVLGALVGIIGTFRWKRLALRPYLDPLALGAAPGWAVARVGCFLVHDHPGVRTTFPLAVLFPDGPRHDLGLYDFFVLAALSGVLALVATKKRPDGVLMGVLAMGYSACRFALDFLRAKDLPFVDARYFGLTPAQFVTAGLFVVGAWLIYSSRYAGEGAVGR